MPETSSEFPLLLVQVSLEVGKGYPEGKGKRELKEKVIFSFFFTILKIAYLQLLSIEEL